MKYLFIPVMALLLGAGCASRSQIVSGQPNTDVIHQQNPAPVESWSEKTVVTNSCLAFVAGGFRLDDYDKPVLVHSMSATREAECWMVLFKSKPDGTNGSWIVSTDKHSGNGDIQRVPGP